MVFEHLAAFFIDKFLGNYIEDFDSDQLKINVWHGDIILENVHLKTNALNNLNVPIEIITGYLEKLKIHIPWKHLYSHPTKIELDGFYLLVSPKTDINYDPQRSEEQEYQSKMKQVEKIENFRHERELYETNKKNPHHKDTFMERLQFHILRNLQIEIKNIHIAFDDKTTKSYPFQFGIIFNSFKLDATDNESENDSNIIYKFGEINNLSIYWNSNIKSRLDLTKEDIIDDLKFDKQSKYPKMNYVLQPLNVRAKLKIAKPAQEQDFEQPVLDAQFDFDEICLNINKNQYSDLLDLLEFQDYLNSKRKYIKYYPIINDNPDEKISSRRWKFAYETILNEFVRPRLASFKWANIKENLDRCKEYHQIYFDQLNHQFIKQHQQKAKELEKQIDVFNLISIRRFAQIEFKKQKLEKKEISWWDQLIHWWSSESNQSITTEEKIEFYEAIGYKDKINSDPLFYPEEYIDINISIKLNLFQINVWSLINQNHSNFELIASSSIPNTEFQYQRRPARDDFLLIIDIDSFEIFGIDSSKLNNSRPILIQPFELNENKLIHIEFETNPINTNSDYRIKALSQSLQINYNAETINHLIQCFLPDRHHDLQGLKEVAYSIYRDIKHRTQFLVSENLKNIQDLDIFIDLKSIYFILPEFGSLNNSSSNICLDSGRFLFKGGQKNILCDENLFYDAKSNFDDENNVPLKIELENIQLLYLNQDENWISIRLKEESPSHLIKPITIKFDIFKSKIIDDPKIPIWKGNGQILSIQSHLSDQRLFGFIQLIKTIPFTQSNQKEKQEEYQTIEKMTTTDKVLYDHENSFEEKEFIQIEASFSIHKIEILFEHSLSDYTEISFFQFVFSTRIETYEILFNIYLEDLIIEHQLSLKKEKILFKEKCENIFELNCLLTSTSNPQFNSIENDISIKLNQFTFHFQFEVISSIIYFINNIKQRLSSNKSNSSIIKKESSSSSPSFKINIQFEGIHLLIGSTILYIELNQLNICLSKTNIEILLNIILNDLSIIDLYPNSLYQNILSKENSSNDLINFELSLFNYSNKLIKKPKDYKSFFKGYFQKLNFIFLYKHIDLILSIINLFQTNKSSSSSSSKDQSFLPLILEKYQEYSIEFYTDFILNCPKILIPVNSYSKQSLSIDLGQISFHTDQLPNEKHSIRLENIFISRNIFECSPFIILINRHLQSQQLSIQIQWDTIHFKLSRLDYSIINQIFKQNLRERFVFQIPKIEINNQQIEDYSSSSPTSTNQISPKIELDFQIKQINLTLYLEENEKFLSLTIENIQSSFKETSNSTYNGKLIIEHIYAQQDSPIIDQLDQNKSFIILNLKYQKSDRTVNGQMESFNIFINPDLINSINLFLNSDLLIKEEIELNVPSPFLSIESKSSSSTKSISNDQNISSTDVTTNVEFILKESHLILIENRNKTDPDCLVLNFSLIIQMINRDGSTKISSSIKDLFFYGSTQEQLKHSKVKYSIIEHSEIDGMIMIDSQEQKMNLSMDKLSINIDPILIRTFVSLSKSIEKQEKTKSNEEKDEIDSKTIFDPKPFKDSTFWYLQDSEEKEESSQKINKLQNLKQQLMIKLNLIEIKVELGKDSSTRPVVAICLSNLFANIENWSTDILITSSIEIELALFNDHLLAWEPLIEPIIDERGIIISPWTINCQTIQDQQDQNDQKYRYLLEDELNEESKPVEKDKSMNLNPKKLILIRGEHLLNLTLTKTTLDLLQRLQIMFNQAYQHGISSDDDQQQAMLSIHNYTGIFIQINHIIGIEFPNEKIDLKNGESINLTIPRERLDATHLPAISEQIAKRKQQFQIQIQDKQLTIDINQTCSRVYDLHPSSNPLWPIQLLCDSNIYQERRRIILSSIIKISNRTLMPLLILDGNQIENILMKIDPNEEFYLPIELIYLKSITRIYFSFEELFLKDSQMNDFISFDWSNESITDRIFKFNSGKQGHYVIYKEEIESYSENTDEPIKKSFNIYIKHALHLLNLLPIQIQCSIDNIENISLKSSELYHSIQGNKKSILIFKIDEYNNSSWISESIDLNTKGHGIHNEYILKFNSQITNEILRMILRVDTYRGSYRASFYSPYWIINSTDLKFELKIENDKTLIDRTDKPYFICPKQFDSQSKKKKGHIRLFGIGEDTKWSEGFSLDVIKSTGITSSEVINDRIYMICIDIVTCSFGMSKIITLLPSTTIRNNSSIDIQINENSSQLNWKLIKSNQVIPYWPENIKEGVLSVKYLESINCFSIKEKDEILLKMNNECIHVQITSTDFDGYKIIFNNYQNGDAPILILNGLTNQNISFSQKDDLRIQSLPSECYVYYTWIDPMKPRELIILINQISKIIEINSSLCGIIDKNIYYTIFNDGPQRVLFFTYDKSIISKVSSSSIDPMKDSIKISLNSIGISIINDISRDDLLYISINPSKELWTEFNSKPISPKMNKILDKHYLKESQFELDKYRIVKYNDDIASINDLEGNSINVKREILDGLLIDYRWSLENETFHFKINNLQIDNQLKISLFPTILSNNDIPGKPFIELSLLKSQSEIKYLKLLIQEFVVRIDQGLILGIISFIKDEKNPAAPSVNMERDLKRLTNPIEDENQNEKRIYFDNLHLSPLKIHVSFSMHGSKASEQLLAEYPLADFLLQILNIAEVQDVILKLNYYERKNARYPIIKLEKEIMNHYENQFLKQIHVLVLGLDVLGNPFGVVRGLKQGVESFFYEPYKGAMEGPVEFLEGIATGTKSLVGSVVGGAADAISKVTEATSKGLATLTLDKDYQNARIQRKEIQSQTTSDIVSSGKNAMKDVILGVKGVVKKPVQGAKHDGTKGFFKGLGKGFLGLVGRPTSGIVDLTSTSFKLIKKITTHEEIIHRIRNPRHIGRDGLVRPSFAQEILGNYLFDKFDDEYHTENEGYIAHIDSTLNPPTLFFATTKRILFLSSIEFSSNEYQIEWDYHYKDIKGIPIIKFKPDFIEINIKETNAIGMTKKDSAHIKVVPYDNVGEARYIVDKIIETTNILEL